MEAIQPFIALAVMVARKAKKATLAIMMLGAVVLVGDEGIRRFLGAASVTIFAVTPLSSCPDSTRAAHALGLRQRDGRGAHETLHDHDEGRKHAQLDNCPRASTAVCMVMGGDDGRRRGWARRRQT